MRKNISIILTVSYESLEIVQQCLASISKLKGSGIDVFFLDQTNNYKLEALVKKIKSSNINFYYLITNQGAYLLT